MPCFCQIVRRIVLLFGLGILIALDVCCFFKIAPFVIGFCIEISLGIRFHCNVKLNNFFQFLQCPISKIFKIMLLRRILNKILSVVSCIDYVFSQVLLFRFNRFVFHFQPQFNQSIWSLFINLSKINLHSFYDFIKYSHHLISWSYNLYH